MSTKQSLPLVFGLERRGDQDVLRHVSEVRSGKSCRCRCCSCDAPLIARKGKLKMHHFAHCDAATACLGGAETALHYCAKQLISEYRSVQLPAVTSKWRATPLVDSRRFQATAARREVKVGQHVADVVLEQAQRTLAVEIKVTHAVDDYKIRNYLRAGQEAIEIDLLAIFYQLQEIHRRLPTLHELRVALLFGKEHRQWLFNRQQHNFEYGLRKRAVPRPIKHLKRPGRSDYWVKECPDPQRQRIKRAPCFTLIYARLHTDCEHCPYRLEVEYEYEWIGYRRVPTLPVRVHCSYGKLKDKLTG